MADAVLAQGDGIQMVSLAGLFAVFGDDKRRASALAQA
jgi:hypothetical protein